MAWADSPRERDAGSSKPDIRKLKWQEGSSRAGPPTVLHRPQIEEGDVVVSDNAVRRGVAVRVARVGPAPHDASVPVLADTEVLKGQCLDLPVEREFVDARPQQLLLDGIEQVVGQGLSLE